MLPHVTVLILLLHLHIWTAFCDPDHSTDVTFALKKLQNLSDSGIYETLTLHKVLSSSETDGIYHTHTLLKMELESPYFKSGQPTEVYDVIVLTHKEDGVKSLAIDEFPVMTDSAIETYLEVKYETKRRERESAFRLLEIEAVVRRQMDQKGENKGEVDIKQYMASKDLSAHLDSLDTPQSLSRREQASLVIQHRISEPFVGQERTLATLSLSQLYDISICAKNSGWSDYSKERAAEILDRALKDLHGE